MCALHTAGNIPLGGAIEDVEPVAAEQARTPRLHQLVPQLLELSGGVGLAARRSTGRPSRRKRGCDARENARRSRSITPPTTRSKTAAESRAVLEQRMRASRRRRASAGNPAARAALRPSPAPARNRSNVFWCSAGRDDDRRLAGGEPGRKVRSDRLGELIELGVDLHRMGCVPRGPQKIDPTRLHDLPTVPGIRASNRPRADGCRSCPSRRCACPAASPSGSSAPASCRLFWASARLSSASPSAARPRFRSLSLKRGTGLEPATLSLGS